LLTYDPATGSVDISWSAGGEERLASPYAAGGRGMELSELVVFNGKLLTCDDRTGIVYEVDSTPAKWDLLPWVILRNGDGRHSSSSSSKGGFKCEWMTVKGGHLYVGSLGKEWTTASGDRVLNADPQWVKRVSVEGAVEHLDWRPAYAALVRAAGITSPPGYLIHEAAVYSERSRRWHFLPRRASHDAYNEVADEQRATNIVLSAEGEDLGRVNLTLAGVGRLSPTHGFSSVKLLPLKGGGETSPEIALALKSEESGDTVASYVTVFRLDDGR
ncbi:PREDICTED: soluble calcium-activated nucleotidase 1, partial [Rhagoletis zephyria]|uniref:soluble calcium-activated nucleotidase 1 n=1 Tax=Rhagoletis zephyria TaxID=28612 RepID=UPI00081194E3